MNDKDKDEFQTKLAGSYVDDTEYMHRLRHIIDVLQEERYVPGDLNDTFEKHAWQGMPESRKDELIDQYTDWYLKHKSTF